LFFFLGAVIILGGLFFWQLSSSLASLGTYSDLNVDKLFTLYRSSQAQTLDQTEGHVNLLILGTDTLVYREASAPLTDTMMLVSLDLNHNRLTLLPLPRDIYAPELGLKINGVYGNFYRQDPAQALSRTQAFFETFTNVPLHYSLVVSLAEVKDFLTLIGGVSVEVQTAFTDYQYPRDDVDIRIVTDPALLYETVSFAAGPIQLDPDLALKFMRSRHGEGNEGNDYARSRRQQQVLSAATGKVGQILLSQVKRYDFTFLGELYQFYTSRFEDQLPFVKFLAFGHYILAQGHLPEVVSAQLAIAPSPGANLQEEEKTEFRLLITNQLSLQKEIKEKLGLSTDL
jgi:LCP family protein required for cell wall assembly